ncbi:MAG: hypothetical protein GX328_04395 [Clostridiaceae bacterium]|nr:hypothetical protein [Clostridiaceae bacterium]
MNNILDFWRVYNYLFPEQSLPFVLLSGLILSLFVVPDSISILNFARQSKFIIFNNSGLRKIYLAYPSGFTYFWILLISVLIASFSYYLFNLSRIVSIPLALIIQTMFAWQVFPTRRYVKPIMQASDIFKYEGTMAGLATLRSNLYGEIKSAPVWQLFSITLQDYLMQVTLYWLIPLIVLFFGFWPFTFFYLTFVIQYKEFNLQNKIIDQVLCLPHLVTIALMRFLFIFCRGSQTEKNNFKKDYLSFNQIFSSEKYAVQKIDSDREHNSADPSEHDFEQVSDKEDRATRLNQDQANEKYRAINLRYLKFVETLCLGAMTIIMGFGLLIIYLRAIF